MNLTTPPPVGRTRRSGTAALLAAALLAAALLAGLAFSTPAPARSEPAWQDTDTGFDGFGGVVALDRGRPRAAYRDTDNTLTYGWCDGACADTGSWQSVDLGPPTLWVDLAIDRWGRPRIAYRAPGVEEAIFYAACDSDCGTAGSWSHSRVGNSSDDGLSLALDPWGRPRLTYVHVSASTGGIHPVFAACDADCASPTGWSMVEFPVSGDNPSIALDGTNPRIAYGATASGPADDLRYLTCDADCFDDDAWTSTIVTSFEGIGQPSLAVDGEAAYIAFNPLAAITSLAYTSCASGCTDDTRWDDPVMLTPGDRILKPDLALANGRPRVLYTHCANCLTKVEERHPYYAACDSGCASEGNWSHRRLMPVFDQVFGSSLALDGERPRVLNGLGRSGPQNLYFSSCDATCGEPGSWPAPPSDPPPPPWPRPESPGGGLSGGGNDNTGGGGSAGSGSAGTGNGVAGPAGSSAGGGSSGGGAMGGATTVGADGRGSTAGVSGGTVSASGRSSRVGTSGDVDRAAGIGNSGRSGASDAASDSRRSLDEKVRRLPGAAIDLVTDPARALRWPWPRILVKGFAIALLMLVSRLAHAEAVARRRRSRLPSTAEAAPL